MAARRARATGGDAGGRVFEPRRIARVRHLPADWPPARLEPNRLRRRPGEFGAKGLALLHELVPRAATICFLENPNNPISELTTRDVLAAAPVVGLKVQILKASSDREIDAAFASLVQAGTGALLVSNDFLFNSRIEQVTALAARYAIPTMHLNPEFVMAGGLISYGESLIEEYRQVGLYVGRILKGEKPADLPVIQATKLELVINLKTAKALGLQIPDRLLALADQVIE